MTAILLTLLAVGRAAAVQIPEDPRGPGKPYLVAVGVGTFSDPAIQPRPTAEADAKALHALLRDP
ncbi:MAG: hypothetical protein NZ703_10820, partial [Gemmataceae bacterium]|nr:hypothetical protein [Gemmataceae bacterium]